MYLEGTNNKYISDGGYNCSIIRKLYGLFFYLPTKTFSVRCSILVLCLQKHLVVILLNNHLAKFSKKLFGSVGYSTNQVSLS
jgi:hypothetical protein